MTLAEAYDMAFNVRRYEGKSWGWGVFLEISGLDPDMVVPGPAGDDE